MNPLFQRHLSVEKTISELYEACLKLASEIQDYEEQACAYAQAEKYLDALRALEDFLIR